MYYETMSYSKNAIKVKFTKIQCMSNRNLVPLLAANILDYDYFPLYHKPFTCFCSKLAALRTVEYSSSSIFLLKENNDTC